MYPRETKDLDILSPPLDTGVLQASKDLATQIRMRGGVLAVDWLNNGPATLAPDLHPGWPAHVRATVADLGRRLGHGV